MTRETLPQSAAIPYREKNGRLKFMLITSSSGLRWIVPKGMVEPDLTPWHSAAKEAVEEAGVEGEIGQIPLCDFRYEKLGMLYHVDVYPLRVTRVLDKWDEMNMRDRAWVSAEEAADRLAQKEIKRAILDLAKLNPWPKLLP